MRYLNRKGDLDEIAQIPSINLFNNWTGNPPRFCFIVPTYKRADLLRFALDSILQQVTSESYEILVVDDNPERGDGTERLMMERFNVPGVAYYKNSVNLRQEGNWNKLFQLARTDWLIMLHDDDMLYPDYMKYMLQCMDLYPQGIGGFFPAFIGKGFENGNIPIRVRKDIQARIIKEVDFLQGCILGAPLGMCVRRDLVCQLGGVNKNSSVAVDYDFFNRLVKLTDVVKMYDYPLGVWRIMDNVSQKESTVLYCIQWGDVLKMETLEDCALSWLKPLYKHYLRGFDEQHLRSWYKEMGKNVGDIAILRSCTTFDKMVYRGYLLYFKMRRRFRRRNKRIGVSSI